MELPPLNLTLPDPVALKYGNVTLFAWDIKGYGTIMNMFAGYTLWTSNYRPQLELQESLTKRLTLCSNRIKLKDSVLEIALEDRDNVYKLYNEEIKTKASLKRQNTIKILLISGGTGLVGIAVGLLFGVFAI